MVTLDGTGVGCAIDCMTALILLAAGRGTRFGGGKLHAPLAGKPLAQHVADRLGSLPFSRLIAVCSHETPDLPGFERVMLPPAEGPLSRSIAAGMTALRDDTSVLIALADMPLVPSAHFLALLAGFDGDVVASGVGALAMVPAVFGARHFAALQNLTGDRGAGALLRAVPRIALDPALALDVDTPEDLLRAERVILASDPIT